MREQYNAALKQLSLTTAGFSITVNTRHGTFFLGFPFASDFCPSEDFPSFNQQTAVFALPQGT